MAPTLFAPATGPGGVIGILRISGPQAREAVQALAPGPAPVAREASLRRLVDPRDGLPLDEALLLFFEAPRSATGEDVLEIHHHAGPAVAAALLEILASLPGFVPAEPGGFTKQAFLNGRLDLTAAEGLADLVASSSLAQARQALRQLDGSLGRLYGGWRERLLDALARVEAEIDFAAEDEVPEGLWEEVRPAVEAVLDEVAEHLADGRRGERLRAGLQVAVTGPPNVGKSSLVNLLAGRDVAIVTPLAGTTRDVLEVALDLEGLPVTLLDTAGLRETMDPIESIGVARARARAETADLRLVLFDDPLTPPPTAPGTLRVLTKLDLQHDRLLEALPPDVVPLSTLAGLGVDRLLRGLAARARAMVAPGSSPALTRARHRAALEEAAAALRRALQGHEALELALKAEDLRVAAKAVGRITGAVGVEEVLDRVFSTFCIGK